MKRFKTLSEDIEILKKVLVVEPEESPPRSYRLGNLGNEKIIIKVKRIACRSMKGKGSNSGLRLIYDYEKESKKITFIELYYKGDKASEDRNRLRKYFKEN